MFDEAEGLDDPYLRTKHESEGLVRKEKRVKWRIYRPGMVVGHSKTGEMDKIDGPYYFFTFLKKLREMLPPWMPTLGIEGGRINIVPVDFVADAMDHIAHKPKLDGHCFHLTDPEPHARRRGAEHLRRAGHAPEMTMRIDARMFAFVPGGVRMAVGNLPPVKRFIGMLLRDFKIPKEVLKFITYPTRFDNRETERALKGSGITVPKLDDYAWRLWDYWERHLDPDLFIDRTLKGKVRNKVVLITGGSSGIGLSTAQRVAEAGATTIIVARGEEELFKARDEMKKDGGKVFAYTADLADMAELRPLVTQVLAEHGHVDILINNAGRSIRRSIEAQLRPLPRFRADHAAELLRQHPPDHGLHAEDDRAPQGPHHQHQFDRRAGQFAAVLRLRRLEGGAGCVQPLRAGRAVGQGHQLHHHQHAAGEDADDRADQDVRQRAHAVAGRSGRPAGQGDHREAEPHRHPPGHLLGPAQRGGAEGLRGGDEHRVRAVPGFGRGQGRPQGAEGRAAQQRADRVRVADARVPSPLCTGSLDGSATSVDR
jgi:nucleoside-diphosphate-sugar epimerase